MFLLPKILIILGSIVALQAFAAVEDEKYWGPLPKNFSSQYLGEAKKLKRAIEKNDGKALSSLSRRGEWRDHTLYALAKLQFKQNQWVAARQSLLSLLNDCNNSALEERAKEMLPLVEIALAESAQKSGKSDEAFNWYFRGFSRLATKRWTEHEGAIRSWNLLYQKKDPLLYQGFLAELNNALPQESELRGEILESKKIQRLPKTRSYLGGGGVKSVYPDQQAFDDAMSLILEEKWQGALDKLKQFSVDFAESDQLDRAWFWEASCLDQLGRKDEAKEKFGKILEKYPLSYYGLQAAFHLEKPLSQLWNATPLPLKELEGALLPKQWNALWRTRALLQVDLKEQARCEAETLFNLRPAGTTLGQDSAAGSLALARLYFVSTYYLGSFTQFLSAVLADKSVIHPDHLRLLFPNVYPEELNKASAEYDLDPLVVLSLTKQESAFLPDVVSHSDAMGLMQLIMPTAKEVDTKLTRESLFEPATNLKAGSAYLRRLLDRYQGNLALALAAYNAGPNRASQWQKKLMDSPLMKKDFRVDVFIDTIPFTETRRYVGSILRNLAWYKTLQNQEVPKTVQELALQWHKPITKP